MATERDVRVTRPRGPAAPRRARDDAGPRPRRGRAVVPSLEPLDADPDPAPEGVPAPDAVRTPGTDPGERAGTLPTEDLLARQEADAEELRQELAELRRILDVPAPRRVSTRRGRGRVQAAALAILLPLGASLVFLVTRPDPGTRVAPAPSATATTVATTAPPTPDGDEVPAEIPVSARRGTLPRTGPGLDRPGALALVEALPDGGLFVVERSVLAAPTTSDLILSLPSADGLDETVTGEPNRLAEDVSGLTPRVEDLRAAVDRVPVPLQDLGDGRWRIEMPAAGGSVVHVSYKLVDAVADRPDGRVALVQPVLDGAMRDAGLPVAVRVIADGVSAVRCTGVPDDLQECAEAGDTGWTARAPGGAPRTAVVLVLDPGA